MSILIVVSDCQDDNVPIHSAQRGYRFWTNFHHLIKITEWASQIMHPYVELDWQMCDHPNNKHWKTGTSVGRESTSR